MFAGIMLLVGQRISRPLVQITEAVRAVARGDWKSEVTGVERVDEVGDIARAVIVLQRSLQERDRLRSDVAHAESVKKRREALEDAIRRFDRIMRSVLLSVSNSVETMDETARELARVSAVAEGEAVEAAFVSENTVSNVSAVRSATERLSAAISETVDGIRQAADVIALSSTAAQSASASAEGLAQTTGEIDAIMRAIADIAAQTNALALNATDPGDARRERDAEISPAWSATSRRWRAGSATPTRTSRGGSRPSAARPATRSARCARSCRSSTWCCTRPARSRLRWSGRTR